MDERSIDEQYNEQLQILEEHLWIEEQLNNQIKARHSGYSLVLTCYSWSLALCLRNIKTDFNQMNDNLHEKSIQNALNQGARPADRGGH